METSRENICATQPYIGSQSLACASYDMVTAASQRSLAGRCVRSFEALLAPKTLWMAAKCAAPCSWEKYGAKTQPLAHFLRKNLQAPHGLHLRHILQKTSVRASIILAENQEAVLLRLLHSSRWVQAIRNTSGPP
ncbi:uncharacterized protein [Lolium perenne]|uniref:uncharacterized protein n=1 Tax=Lolium perenne TaxID=4522 RepID=UPI003A99385D